MYDRAAGFGRRNVSGSHGGAAAIAANGGSAGRTSQITHDRVSENDEDVDFRIIGNDMQVLEIDLDPGESIIAEPGAMVWKDFDIEPAAMLDAGSVPGRGIGGKLLDAGKRMLSGENLFLAVFSNAGVGMSRRAKIAFSSPLPGTIVPLRLADYGGKLICQRDSFLAAARGVSVGVTLIAGFRGKGLSGMVRGGLTGMFGGEGFVMQKLEGDGWAFVHMGGTVFERQLGPGERIHIDTGCVAAYTQGVDYCVVMAGGGIRNRFLGGEGVYYAALTGPGTVWIQSVPFARLAMQIAAAGGSGDATTMGAAGAVGAVGALGLAGVAGIAAAGHVAEGTIEDFGGDMLDAAMGADVDSGLLGALGNFLSGN